jgi:hypothetical protein
MDVHEWHGNLPIHLENKDAVRLSIVCYLRHRLWKKTRGKTKKFMQKHVATYRRLHDLTNKLSDKKGGANDDSGANDDIGAGEVVANNADSGMNY